MAETIRIMIETESHNVFVPSFLTKEDYEELRKARIPLQLKTCLRAIREATGTSIGVQAFQYEDSDFLWFSFHKGVTSEQAHAATLLLVTQIENELGRRISIKMEGRIIKKSALNACQYELDGLSRDTREAITKALKHSKTKE